MCKNIYFFVLALCIGSSAFADVDSTRAILREYSNHHERVIQEFDQVAASWESHKKIN